MRLPGPTSAPGGVSSSGTTVSEASGGYGTSTNPNAPTSTGAASTGSATNNVQTTDDAMQTFYKNMMAPIDMNDPGIKSILQGAQSSAGAAANAQGIGGPMSVAAGQNAYMGTAATMDMQRKGMALGAMGQLSNSQLGLGGLNLGYGQLGLAQNQEAYAQNWNNTYGPAQMVTQDIGNVLGGLGSIGKVAKSL